jgi:Site-specific recombinase XerD
MNKEIGQETYAEYLFQKELAENTKKVYIKQAELFLEFMGGRHVTKKETITYKQKLLADGKSPASTNLYITAVNSYLQYAGLQDCCIKTARIQKKQCPDNIISPKEYQRMLTYAKEYGKKKYYCIMRTLASTGIRVSELSGCTIEALSAGKFTICSKGKTREIYLPDRLIAELRDYCKQEGIVSGVIFRGTGSRPICRSAVYKMLVHIADMEGIPKEKVHPHSFRHLFAITYLRQYSDLSELADILGHSSLETTRIYTRTTAEERRKRMDELKF